MKKILIIGGTQFVGRILTEELIKDNKYDITLFNRGITNPDIFPDVKIIKGDRNTDAIRLITGQYWDCIIDMAGFYPKSLQKLIDTIKGKTRRYIFISTLSHFKFNTKNDTPVTEEHETLECSEEESIDTTMVTYNQRKAECERVLLKTNDLDKIILRPSLIFGTYDPTDRLYYWLYRAKKNNELLIPNNGKNVISYTYVYDLVKTIVKSIEIEKHNIVYNVSTISTLSLETIINETVKKAGRSIKFINVSPEFLKENGINPWSDVPLWVEGNWFVFDNKKIKKDFNIEYKDYKECLIDTIAYYEKSGWPQPKYGLSLEKETMLIQKIYSRT